MKSKNIRWPYFKTLEKEIGKTIKLALKEDIGLGDVTSDYIFSHDSIKRGTILVKEKGVVAGLTVVEMVFRTVSPRIQFQALVKDGSVVGKGKIVAQTRGPLTDILAGERTALNFLQRMSGIATLTYEFVHKVAGTKTIILDTRKTAPGLRYFDKWAVFLGGGQNHRMGLYDMILIKDNHIQAAGGIKPAVEAVLRQNRRRLKIEVEVENFDQLRQALNCPVDRIMLDNMNPRQIKEAVKMTKDKVKLEVSGGVNLDTVAQFAKLGVDFISIGTLTHSAKALDISLEIY